MLSIRAQQEIRRETLRTLIQFGLLPDPISGMYETPPSNQQYLDMLQPPPQPAPNPQMPNGTPSLDAKPEGRIIPLSTLEMDITGLSSLIFRLGVAMEELDTLISNLTKHRGTLHELFTAIVDGVRGPDAVDNSDTDRGVDAQT